MDPPQESQQMSANTLMVITPAGKILQLFTPIKAVCTTTVLGIPIGTTVFIESIVIDKQYKMCYKITGVWYVYWCFSIIK